MKKKALSFLDRVAFYPLFIGIYPVLSLYSFNISEVKINAIEMAVITSLIVILILSLICLIAFRSWEKAALYAAFSLLFFLAYGHVFNLLSGVTILGLSIGRHRYILTGWIILYVYGVYHFKKIKNFSILNRPLNTMFLLLVAIPTIQIVFTFGEMGIAHAQNQSSQTIKQDLHSDTINRDVYYILMDGYSREDLLREKLGLDTSEFIHALKEMGFYIPNCSQSNYSQTSPSLASSLNMNYLDALGLGVGADARVDLTLAIHNNSTRRSFEALGYQTVTFKNTHPSIDIQDSNYYYDYFKDVSNLNQSDSVNFQYLFLNTTAFLPVREYLETQNGILLPSFLAPWIPIGNSLNSREYRQYQQNLYALKMLEEAPKLPGKKFIYAHLFTTHQPYVFYPDGKFHPSLVQGPAAYRDQVIFADTRLLEVIKTILDTSQVEPIIILQSDHSYFHDADSVKILNAYHLPGEDETYLYDTITPANTFRVIFNIYFNGDYLLLPDVSRYKDKNGNLVTVPSTCIK